MTTMKSLSLKSLFVSVSVIGAVACGGGGSGSSGNTTANPQAASSTVSSTGMLQSSIGSMNGQSAGNALSAIGSSAQGIVTYAPEGQTGALVQLQDTLAQLHANTNVAMSSNAPGDCICDASGNCTFDMCGGSGYLMSGTITRSGDSYTIDIQMTASTTGIEYEWDYQGAVTMSATSIDGNLSGTGTGTVMAGDMTISYDFDWDVTYNAIVLDATGCATGGSLDAHVSFSVDGTGGAGAYSGDATVTFGPTCGAATAT